MSDSSNEDLIESAASVLNRHVAAGRLFGDVGAALISEDGNLFLGVCIDTGAGICAETSAIAAMVTAGEYKIRKIVAVWRDEKSERLYALPACGRCRQLIREVDEDNLSTDVILGRDKTVPLKELLPFNEWPEPLG